MTHEKSKCLAEVAVDLYGSTDDTSLLDGSPDMVDEDLIALGVVAVVTILGKANVFIFNDSSMALEEFPNALYSVNPQGGLAERTTEFLKHVQAFAKS